MTVYWLCRGTTRLDFPLKLQHCWSTEVVKTYNIDSWHLKQDWISPLILQRLKKSQAVKSWNVVKLFISETRQSLCKSLSDWRDFFNCFVSWRSRKNSCLSKVIKYRCLLIWSRQQLLSLWLPLLRISQTHINHRSTDNWNSFHPNVSDGCRSFYLIPRLLAVLLLVNL